MNNFDIFRSLILSNCVKEKNKKMAMVNIHATKNFTKNDIKAGFIVQCRDGSMRLVTSVGREGTLIVLSTNGDWSYLSGWSDEFNYYDKDHKHDLDIVKVYGLVEGACHYKLMPFDFLVSARRVLWERVEAKKMTVSEIEKALGYKIEVVAE